MWSAVLLYMEGQGKQGQVLEIITNNIFLHDLQL